MAKEDYRSQAKARRLDLDVDAIDWDMKLVNAGITVHYEVLPVDVCSPLMLPMYCRYKKEQRLAVTIEKPTRFDKATLDEANMEMERLHEKAKGQKDKACRAYMEAFKLAAETGGNRLAKQTIPINDQIAAILKKKTEGKSKVREFVEILVSASGGTGAAKAADNAGVSEVLSVLLVPLTTYAIYRGMDLAYDFYIEQITKDINRKRKINVGDDAC